MATTVGCKGEYVYDPAGNAIEVTYPANDAGGLGETVATTFNTRGLPVTLTGDGTYSDDDYVTAAGHDALTRLVSRTSGTGPNALDRAWSYDPATLRLDTLTAAVGSTDVVDLTYGSWDDTGNLLRIVDATNGNQAQCFEYDDLDRLTRGYTTGGACNGTANTSVGVAGYNDHYSYDDLGNLTSIGGVAFQLQGNRYQPRRFGTIDLRWDHNGMFEYWDATGPGRVRYRSDFDNNLDAVVSDVDGTTLLRYDGDGTRVVRETPTDTTVFIDGRFEWNDTEGEATLHYQLDGDHIAVRVDGDLHWTIGDHLGSVTATIEAATGTHTRQLYDPWDRIRTNNGAIAVPTDLGYTGQRLDEHTGLMHCPIGRTPPTCRHIWPWWRSLTREWTDPLLRCLQTRREARSDGWSSSRPRMEPGHWPIPNMVRNLGSRRTRSASSSLPAIQPLPLLVRRGGQVWRATMTLTPPSLVDVAAMIKGLLSGRVSRREASAWAAQWIDAQDPQVTDDVVWSALTSLGGADLKGWETEYLFQEGDFHMWLDEVEDAIDARK